MSRFCATILAIGCVSACVAGEVERPSLPEDYTGWMQLGLTVGPGMDIREVSYRISGPSLGLPARQGVVDVSTPGGAVSALFAALPAGEGYRIDLMTVTVDRGMTCAGEASFAVIAGQTTDVAVAFDCRKSDGSVTIDVAVNNCPTITGLLVAPRAPDGTIAVAAAIAEPDRGDNLRYTWGAGRGRYLDPRSSATTFVCPAESSGAQGSIQGSVQVSDGSCVVEARLELACGAPVGPAGAVAAPPVSQALTVAPGVEVTTIGFRITGTDIEPRAGDIDVRGSSGTSTFTLPGGASYVLALTGVSTDGQTTCRGERAFDVPPGRSARVPIALQCRRTPGMGAVGLRTTFNTCPEARIAVVGASAGTFSLSAAANDAEATSLRFRWTSDRGRFSVPESPSPTYHCDGAGTVLLRLTVSDGSCETVVYQEVGCQS